MVGRLKSGKRGPDVVTPDPWTRLRQWTVARIALGRAGTALPTKPLLEFQLAHAQAKDAVVRPCDFTGLEGLRVASRATTRAQYLKRPDLGRLLNADSEQRLEALAGSDNWDVGLVVGDGLSSLAVDRQASPFLRELVPRLTEAGCRLSPLVLASQARVALSDEIGARLRAEVIVMLIGERPGLSSPDSLSVYLTWGPRRGRQNAERNCVSNIRPDGLGFAQAAQTVVALVRGARWLGESGIRLKEDSWLEAPGTPT